MNSAFNRLAKILTAQGFSIIEVMVGGAILAAVGLGGATLFRNQKVGQKRIEVDQNLQVFHTSLAKIIHNPKNCNATLSAFHDQPSLNDSISEIYYCNNCNSTSTNYNAENSPRMNPAFIREGDWIENVSGNTTRATQTWRVESIGWATSTVVAGTRRPALRITYQMNPNLGSRRVTKDINLNLRFNGANFNECSAGMESTSDNLAHDICETLDPDLGQVATPGKLVYWSPEEQRCLPNLAVMDCANFQSLVGISNLGVVSCRPTSSQFNPAPHTSPGCRPTFFSGTILIKSFTGVVTPSCT